MRGGMEKYKSDLNAFKIATTLIKDRLTNLSEAITTLREKIAPNYESLSNDWIEALWTSIENSGTLINGQFAEYNYLSQALPVAFKLPNQVKKIQEIFSGARTMKDSGTPYQKTTGLTIYKMIEASQYGQLIKKIENEKKNVWTPTEFTEVFPKNSPKDFKSFCESNDPIEWDNALKVFKDAIGQQKQNICKTWNEYEDGLLTIFKKAVALKSNSQDEINSHGSVKEILGILLKMAKTKLNLLEKIINDSNYIAPDYAGRIINLIDIEGKWRKSINKLKKEGKNGEITLILSDKDMILIFNKLRAQRISIINLTKEINNKLEEQRNALRQDDTNTNDTNTKHSTNAQD